MGLYIETARRQDPKEEATPRIKVLMVAAAAELMMEKVACAALSHRITNGPVALALMDRSEGLNRLKGLFKDLVGESVHQVLTGQNFAVFAQDWEGSELRRPRAVVSAGR